MLNQILVDLIKEMNADKVESGKLEVLNCELLVSVVRLLGR